MHLETVIFPICPNPVSVPAKRSPDLDSKTRTRLGDKMDGTKITRRELLKTTVAIAGSTAGLVVSSAYGVKLARAAEDVEICTAEEVLEYAAYLQTLDFASLSRVAISEDGYWGMGTTSIWQAYIYGLDVTGCIYHQWRSNIAANPGLTSGWYSDSTLAGDSTIVAIQHYAGAASDDGIIGSATIRSIQSRLGTVQDGVFSGPSNAIRAMQSNFANLNRPW